MHFQTTGQGEAVGKTLELVGIHKDGREIPIELSLSSVKINEKWHAVGIVRDTSERGKMQATLREKEAHFRNLADFGMALIWTSGLDMKCNYFNRPWLEFTGRTLEQEMGDGWAEGVHPEDLDACFKTYVGAFEKRERFSMVYRIRRHDGEYRWIQDDGAPRYDHNGEFLGFIGHCLDVTDQIQVTTALKESEERFRTMMNNSADAVFIADQKGNYLYVNQKATEMLGYSFEELTKMNIAQVSSKKTLDEDMKTFQKLLETGKLFFETELLKKDGRTVPVDLNAVVMENGQIYGSCRDISERRNAEEKIKTNLLELERYKRATVDRELKMIELKEEMRALREKQSGGKT
jgi:PAS domain S-box-containing protein